MDLEIKNSYTVQRLAGMVSFKITFIFVITNLEH